MVDKTCNGINDVRFMKWSILIPTLPDDKSRLFMMRIRSILDPQLREGIVEIIPDDRGKEIPTGVKRNELIQKSQAEYFSFVDCDDLVSVDYVSKIMEGINMGVDVVSFCGWMTTNGGSHVNWVIKLGEEYVERGGMYYRFPNHLCCFKKSLVEHVKFPPIHQGEDYQWALNIRNLSLLKTEHHITDQLYHYDFRTNKNELWTPIVNGWIMPIK